MPKKKTINPLEKLFIDVPVAKPIVEKPKHKTYKAYARVKGQNAMQSKDGLMAIYWDGRLAKDELLKDEKVVKVRILIDN